VFRMLTVIHGKILVCGAEAFLIGL
jgi:hypothetical protein